MLSFEIQNAASTPISEIRDGLRGAKGFCALKSDLAVFGHISTLFTQCVMTLKFRASWHQVETYSSNRLHLQIGVLQIIHNSCTLVSKPICIFSAGLPPSKKQKQIKTGLPHPFRYLSFCGGILWSSKQARKNLQPMTSLWGSCEWCSQCWSAGPIWEELQGPWLTMPKY